MNRRRFLVSGAAAAGVGMPALRALGQDSTAIVSLQLHPERAGALVPANFVGLSYETQQLSDPEFFRAKNAWLVALFRALAPHGVLRLGGNTSDVGWWKEKERPKWPERVTANEATKKLAYAITPEAVHNLHGFLEATGWTCIYGINLGTNTPERAVEEAAYVEKTLGARLEYFQLGNEPDLFQRRLRDARTWNVDTYMQEWLEEARAIVKRMPKARFGLPDTSGNPEWSAQIAGRLAGSNMQERLACVSHHYYFGGPPSNEQVNIERLLHADAKVAKTAATIRMAAERLGVAYRMTEGNTCYQGGKPGVSDVFAASLWAADYMLQLAQLGYAGVNLHGGGGKAVADSLGGTLPGEALMDDPKAPHPRPFYTPIAYVDGKYVAEPVYYGMLLAQRFAGAAMVPVDFDPGSVNATAYAGKHPSGAMMIAIVNKDTQSDLRVKLLGVEPLAVQSLFAPSVTSNDVTFNESKVTQESALAQWHASAKAPIRNEVHTASPFIRGEAVIPKSSAMWVSVK